MNCPACNKELPFHFAFSSGIRKKACPLCHQGIAPTDESLGQIQKISVIISFLAGIPLGAICAYIWLGTLQMELAMIIFVIGILGVMGSAFIYTRSHIRFRLDNLENLRS